MEAIILKPALKDIIWGGDRLIKDFGFSSESGRIAEAWVVSAHKNGESTAVGGHFDGLPLSTVLSRHPEYAPGCENGFPLLVKLIDAARDLSIQVHPDDAYAAEHENSLGKTEMWYVVDAAPGACLYYGFSGKTDKNGFSAAISDGTVCDLLNKVECKKGDVFFIPAGTVHAIGAGLLICEIQQSSDVTYRIFDYNRPGADGKPRQLHIEQASQCADYRPSEPDGKPCGEARAVGGAEVTPLVECELFKVSRYRVRKGVAGICANGFELLTVLDGEGFITAAGEKKAIKKGDGVFLPAKLGKYRISGSLEYIKTTL